MARVELSWREVRDDAFPDLCLRCGAPADDRVEKTFRWMPWWRPLVAVPLGVILVPVGAVPVLGKRLYRTVISGLATPREMVVRAPLCAAHRNHWRWRQAVSWVGIIALGVMVAAAEVLFYSPKSPWLGARWLPGHGAFYAWIGGGFLLWLVAVAIVGSTGVRAARITEREITLGGVAAAFAERLIRDREESRRGAGPARTPTSETGPLPTGDSSRYRVIAESAEGSPPERLVRLFEDRETARGYAQFLRDSGSFCRVVVENVPPPGPSQQEEVEGPPSAR